MGVADHIASLVEAAPAPIAPTRVRAKSETDPKLISGVTASPGLAVGIAVRFIAPDIEVPEQGAGVVQESAELARARGVVRHDLEKASAHGERHRRSILAAHIALLDDPELLEAAQAALAEGTSAGAAWRKAVRAQIAVLKALDDARMVERAADLADLERQVLLALLGEQPHRRRNCPRTRS